VHGFKEEQKVFFDPEANDELGKKVMKYKAVLVTESFRELYLV